MPACVLLYGSLVMEGMGRDLPDASAWAVSWVAETVPEPLSEPLPEQLSILPIYAVCSSFCSFCDMAKSSALYAPVSLYGVFKPRFV